MTIRAITFDFWGTLFRDQDAAQRHRLRVDALAAATVFAHEEVDAALKQAHEEFFRVHVEEQRTLVPRDAVRMAAETLGATLEPEVVEELAVAFAEAILHHPCVPVEDALEAVGAAAERYPVALICDSGISPGSSLRVLLEEHGFDRHLRVLTFSDEVGVAKPQAPMFERTAVQLGVAPEELLHIGDLEPTDIAGVHAVGGCAALFTGVNPRFVESTSAEHVFRSWQEFLERLPEL
jgi:FMN phosphatase YigB (HAD superfamily)